MSETSLYRKIIANETGLWSIPCRGALRAVESLYGFGINIRNQRYDQQGPKETLSVPVISVGNITVGGTGKTPFVIELIKRLERMGLSPAIVARGYKSIDGEPNDEELLIRQQCPSVVYVANKDRIAGAQTAISNFGADVIVLDDGFQHRRLARTIDVVLIDATCPFGYGHVLPRGLLREPVDGLQRADVIVLTRCDQVSQQTLEQIEKKLIRITADIPLIKCIHRITSVTKLDGEEISESLSDKRALIFAGIAQPQSFAMSVASMGVNVVAQQWWPDHYHYRTRDIHELLKSDRYPPYDLLLTTQKDAVKLAKLNGISKIQIGVVKIEIDFIQDGGTMWQSVLDQSLKPDKQI